MTVTRFLRTITLSAPLLLAPVFALPARAADPGATDPPARPEGRGRLDPAALAERLEAALKELNLTDEQKAKAKEVMAKGRKALAEIKGEGRERLTAAARALADLRRDVNGLLTEEQRKALTEKLPLLGRRAAGEAPAVMQQAIRAAVEKLDLSPEQKAKLRAVNDEAQAKLKAAAAEARDQGQGAAEKVVAILQEQRRELDKVLSGDHAAKFQAAVREQLEKLRGDRREAPEKDE